MPSVSVLRETRDNDRRVILIPSGVRVFTETGINVLVESGAGAGLDIRDGEYEQAGATIVTRDDAWRKSELILKWKRPSAEEWVFLERPMSIAAHFYPGESYALVQHMARHGLSAYSYEYFQASDGSFPLMTTDSEISGKLAVLIGANQLMTSQGGRGIILTSMPHTRSPKVVVIGHGNAGGAAARLAAALGNDVVVLGHRRESLRRFEATVPPNIRCRLASKQVLEEEIPSADLVIGTILISTYDTPAMVDDGLVCQMRPGSVIVDVTCGYGPGYLPTAEKLTRLGAPPYEVHGVWHFKDPVMPTSVHITSAMSAAENHVHYLLNFARSVLFKNFSDETSRRGCFLDNGNIIHPHVLSDFDLIERDFRSVRHA